MFYVKHIIYKLNANLYSKKQNTEILFLAV